MFYFKLSFGEGEEAYLSKSETIEKDVDKLEWTKTQDEESKNSRKSV